MTSNIRKRTLGVLAVVALAIGMFVAASPSNAATKAKTAAKTAIVATVVTASNKHYSKCGTTWTHGKTWVCLLKPAPKKPGMTANTVPAYSGPTEYDQSPGGTWYVFSAKLAYFNSDNAIAYGFTDGDENVYLGTVDFNLSWTASGTDNRSMTTGGNFTSSTAVSGLDVLQSMQNGGAGVSGGGSDLGNCAKDITGHHNAGAQYTIVGCTKSDSANHDHNMTVEFEWTNSEYPANYWDCYARSPVMHTNTTGGLFTFYKASWLAGENGNTYTEDHIVCGYNGDRTYPFAP